MEIRATFETWTSRSIKIALLIFGGQKLVNILNIVGYLLEMTLNTFWRWFIFSVEVFVVKFSLGWPNFVTFTQWLPLCFLFFRGLLAFFGRKRPRNTLLDVVAGIPRVSNLNIYFCTPSLWDQSCDPIEPPFWFCLPTFLKLAPYSGPDLMRSKSPMELLNTICWTQ